MPIWTVKPSAVDVVDPNVGVNAAVSEVPVNNAEPATEFSLVIVTVAVELVAGATPVTVTRPVPSPDTSPDERKLFASRASLASRYSIESLRVRERFRRVDAAPSDNHRRQKI